MRVSLGQSAEDDLRAAIDSCFGALIHRNYTRSGREGDWCHLAVLQKRKGNVERLRRRRWPRPLSPAHTDRSRSSAEPIAQPAAAQTQNERENGNILNEIKFCASCL